MSDVTETDYSKFGDVVDTSKSESTIERLRREAKEEMEAKGIKAPETEAEYNARIDAELDLDKPKEPVKLSGIFHDPVEPEPEEPAELAPKAPAKVSVAVHIGAEQLSNGKFIPYVAARWIDQGTDEPTGFRVEEDASKASTRFETARVASVRARNLYNERMATIAAELADTFDGREIELVNVTLSEPVIESADGEVIMTEPDSDEPELDIDKALGGPDDEPFATRRQALETEPAKRKRGRPRKALTGQALKDAQEEYNGKIDAGEYDAIPPEDLTLGGDEPIQVPPTPFDEPDEEPAVEPMPEPVKVYGLADAREAIEAGIALCHPIMLEGHTGTAKTGLLKLLAFEHGKTLRRVNLDGQTGPDDLAGRILLEGGATVWANGVLTEAMIKGHWIVLDELNAALADVLFLLHPVLDGEKVNEGELVLTEHKGQIIKPHKDFRLFATMNPSDEYDGTKDLNRALRRRFKTWVLFEPVDGETEQRILVERTGIDADEALAMVEFAASMRNEKHLGHILTWVSTADLLGWAELAVYFKDSAKAFIYSVFNRCPDADKEKALEIIQRINRDMAGIKVKLGAQVVNTPLYVFQDAIRQVGTAKADAEAIAKEAYAAADAIKEAAKIEAERLTKESWDKANEITAREEALAKREANFMSDMRAKIEKLVAQEMSKTLSVDADDDDE